MPLFHHQDNMRPALSYKLHPYSVLMKTPAHFQSSQGFTTQGWRYWVVYSSIGVGESLGSHKILKI